MTRARRHLEFINPCGIRRVKFKSTQVSEHSALDALVDSGYPIPPRLQTRANRLTHPNDDLVISGLLETY